MADTSRLLKGNFPRSFGKYSLMRELGRGAMGLVFEAAELENNRIVALKVMLSAEDTMDPALEEMFTREMRVCAALPKHPGIVEIYEAGSLNGRHFIAMERIDGISFHEWRQRNSPELRTQVRILRDVALAAHHAHEGHVLHRDLTPRNVLVDAQGRPRVTDFGTAKRMKTSTGSSPSSGTGAGTVVGTPSYMSPEQAQGLRDVDRRTDVYSLGAMLYEILTGKPPFPGEMTIVALMRVVQDEIIPPSKASSLWAQSLFDKSIEATCMKALSKKRENRHATAREFADELSRWLGEVPAAPPPRGCLGFLGGK